MATAKKLPSGNWRALVYSHTDKDKKRHYESFTAPTKREAEKLAADYVYNKEQSSDQSKITLGEAIDQYIESKKSILSPATIRGYKRIRKYAFQSLMDIPIKKITNSMLADAVLAEMDRSPHGKTTKLTPKTVKNEYGLISSVLSKHNPGRVYHVDLPRVARKIRTLPEPSEIFRAVKGTNVELPCLLAMWLSFSESEIRGLTKSNSIDGDYITIREVVVYSDDGFVRKELAKTSTRTRRHKIPPYIKSLIDQVDGDILVPQNPSVILRSFKRHMRAAGLPEISFHDLRHVNASLMAVLHIPDKYAQERGGWATDNIMKQVYTEVFSAERQRVDDTINDYFSAFIT